jgi:hypothetical protein
MLLLLLLLLFYFYFFDVPMPGMFVFSYWPHYNNKYLHTPSDFTRFEMNPLIAPNKTCSKFNEFIGLVNKD